ncbi:jupiter microtubule associated homolog 2 [Denticeps clupeoides]|uniref:Hematological and neurological expressed 1-like protein n=1 Tax=Denticeps clupeoides TaxID=299321 RepID=A0AAY4BJ65_9TELE|nr:jupiter microtubule associated homolog 2 [Denticeps clupeoides]
MSSTNTFQGLDNSAKPSSRVLRPPGGGSSNLFGGYEEDSPSTRRPNQVASKIFSPAQDPQGVQKRSNPPGGKSSGIFGEAAAQPAQVKPCPPGGITSSIFEQAPCTSPTTTAHPNKPKDNIGVGVCSTPEPPAPPKQVTPVERVKEAPPTTPVKEEHAVTETPLKNHEPHLGPRPRSQTKVLNPPGGKSSVVFY